MLETAEVGSASPSLRPLTASKLILRPGATMRKSYLWSRSESARLEEGGRRKREGDALDLVVIGGRDLVLLGLKGRDGRRVALDAGRDDGVHGLVHLVERREAGAAVFGRARDVNEEQGEGVGQLVVPARWELG